MPSTHAYTYTYTYMVRASRTICAEYTCIYIYIYIHGEGVEDDLCRVAFGADSRLIEGAEQLMNGIDGLVRIGGGRGGLYPRPVERPGFARIPQVCGVAVRARGDHVDLIMYVCMQVEIKWRSSGDQAVRRDERKVRGER